MSLRLRQTVLDTEDARGLAEFYRQLLGLHHREGDERSDGDWLVLCDDAGPRLAFQQVPDLPRPTWPDGPRPQMLHLDLTVGSVEELDEAHVQALALGAVLLVDRSADPDEPLRVYADPSGHPFCVFVG